MEISFAGLGIMGSRMAGNLLKNGTEITVANRSAGPREALAKRGAKPADSFADAARTADVFFTMLARPEAVAEVMWGTGETLAALRPGSLWVDCSTVDPSFARQCAARAAERGVRYLEAPVAGSRPQAEAAALTFFVGGDPRDLDPIRSLLEQMGQKILPMGEVGAAASFKLLVNAMLAQSMVLFAEAVQLGAALGLDREMLLDTLPNLPVAAPFLKAKVSHLRGETDETQFPLELMHKDLHLAGIAAYEAERPFHLGSLSAQLYARGVAAGMGREDFSAIFRLLGNG